MIPLVGTSPKAWKGRQPSGVSPPGFTLVLRLTAHHFLSVPLPATRSFSGLPYCPLKPTDRSAVQAWRDRTLMSMFAYS